jgi:hypothetical protein
VEHRGQAHDPVEDAGVNDGFEVGEGARIRRSIVDNGTVISPVVPVGFDRGADERLSHVTPAGIAVVARGPIAKSEKAPARRKGGRAAGATHRAAPAAAAEARG